MTAIVGVLCRDGAVIGADSSATFSDGSFRTIEQPTEKLSVISDRVIVAGTGSVGLGQRFERIARTAYEKKIFRDSNHIEVGKHLSREAIQDFSSTGVKMGQYGALVGFPIGNQPFLCELAVADFQPEFKDKGIWYGSMGSGQPITDPFLALMRSVFWTNGLPSVQDATFAVTWALDHAIEVNPGGINGPIRVAVLEQDPKHKNKVIARMLEDSELQEHKDNIEGAKDVLRDYASAQRSSENAPDVPSP